ncbi:delta-latroinsectotoxin-Lt1a-like [Parasteatoda tepidariorum]|uniref:delta-latroinsectotoxin-Lt1a-like n=1 Tax=Parasteatoda tepidariorum TaxID=114398 RepID=UPI0039BD8819
MSNETLLQPISFKNHNNIFLERLKREDDEINEAELQERDKKCKDMEISSGVFGAVSDFYGDIGDALGAIPVIGDIAKGVAQGTVAVANLVKNGLDIAQTALDCDQVPFDELKLVINKKFNEVERKLDKMTETLGEISEKVSTTLIIIETAREEMKQGFKNVKDTIKNVDINNKIFAINNFISYYEEEMKEINRLPKEDYIRKLLNEDNVLKKLRDVRTPAQLRAPLTQLLDTISYILEKGEDGVPFSAIDSIFQGTQTYAFVMFFLLGHHNYLANYYYQLGRLDMFNDQLDIIKDVFNMFSHFLAGHQKPLIDRVIHIIERVTRNKEYSGDKSLLPKINFLTDLKNKIKSINLSIIAETPENDITISFEEGIENPGSDWKMGSVVKYALQFKRGDIYSRVSKWKIFKINEKGNPSLRMPTDLRRDRLIFRQIDNHKAELVGIIKKSEIDFKDINRDLYNAAGNPTEQVALREVNLYLQNGADIRSVFENGRSAIHAAALAGHDDLIKVLLQNKVDINVRDDKGYTPLHIAAQAGRGTLVNLLVENGADENAKTNDELLTPLHLASRRGYLDCVRNLLKNETVNEKNKLGFTPLHSAVSGGHVIVETIVERIEYSPDVNAQSEKDQLTPLHLAVINGDLKVVQSLMRSEKIDLNVKDRNKLTPLHYAALAPASINNLMIVQNLVNAKERVNPNLASENHWTPLHFAIFNRNTDVALELIETGIIDLSSLVDGNYTLLHLATATGLIKVIRELLQRGAIIEAETKEGYTALHLGAMRKEPEIVPMFIGKGAIVKARTKDGSTPLHYAAAAGRSHTVLYLLENGGSIRDANSAGRYPIHEAVTRGHSQVTQIFLDKDFKLVYERDKQGKSPFDIAAEHLCANIIYDFVDRGLNLTAWYGDGRPPLSIFAKIGSLEMVKFFLSKGSDPNAIDFENKNFFDLAAEYGFENIVEYVFVNQIIDSSKIEQGVCKAIEHGQLNIIKYFIGTQKEMLCNPLQTAALKGQMHITQYLVEEAGIYVNAVQNHQTALCNAVKGGYYNIAKYLVGKRASIYDDCSTDSKKYTSLIYAVENKRVKIFKFLIDKIPDPNKQDGFGNTPLYYTALFGCLYCARYLIRKKNVDVNGRNSNGDTALHIAYETANDAFVTFLQKNGAEYFLKNNDGDIPLAKYASTVSRAQAMIQNKDPESVGKLSVKDVIQSIRNQTQYGYRFRRNVNYSSRVRSSKTLDSLTTMKQYIISPELVRGHYINPKSVRDYAANLEPVGETTVNEVKQLPRNQTSYGYVNSSRIISSLKALELLTTLRQNSINPNSAGNIDMKTDPVRESTVDEMLQLARNKTEYGHSFRQNDDSLSRLSPLIDRKSLVAMEPKQTLKTTYAGFKNTDVNGTLLLLDILLRKFTKEKYAPFLEQGTSEMEVNAFALRITEAIEKFLTLSANSQTIKGIDFFEVYLKIFKALISENEHKLSDILYNLLQNAPDKTINN